MTFTRDLSGNNPIDLKYSPSNRTAADLTAILALTPLYPGEIVRALNTGREYRAVNTTTWGLIGPVTSVVAGTLPQPSVIINKSVGQPDPTGSSPISFTVTFSQDMTGFVTGDVTLSGTVGGTLVGSVGGGPNTYTVFVTGMTTSGSVIANVAAGVATGAGGLNTAAPSAATVAWLLDTTAPTVTINQGGGQADPTSGSPIFFSVQFSEVVTGFGPATGSPKINFAGSTVGGTLSANISAGTGDTYLVSVNGMAAPSGTVVVSIIAGAAVDGAGNASLASTSTDNVVTWVAPDTISPSVAVGRSAGQSQPTSVSPISFDVDFSETVTGFTASDVNFAGTTAGGTLVAVVSGSGSHYTVSITGMTTSGDVVMSVPAGVAVDLAGNPNTATPVPDLVTWVAPGGTGLKAPLGMGLFLN
jgi:hypothetical protein